MRRLLLAAGLFAFAGAVVPSPRPDYPFAVGESFDYDVKLGLLTLGRARASVVELDTIRGVEAFVFHFHLAGKSLFYDLDDLLLSWVGTRDFTSLRFRQELKEGGKQRLRNYEIYPERRIYRLNGSDSVYQTPADPLDDIAFLYFMRIASLEVDQTYRYPRYFRRDRNPLIVRVTKREKLTLPGGEKAECLVLAPTVDHTRGIFSKRSNARVWLTDDRRRIPVQIRSRFPFGTLTLKLKAMTLPDSESLASER